MIPVSDLSRDALTKAHQEYANKESAHRALGAYADDVILSGIVTSIASEGKEVKSKKNPAWEGFVSRSIKIILDQDCIDTIVMKWGPSSSGHGSCPKNIGFIHQDNGEYIPMLLSEWSKTSLEKLDAAFPDGNYPVDPPVTPLVAGSHYTFEMDDARVEGVDRRHFVRIIGARSSASYAAPSEKYKQHRAFYNLAGRMMSSIGPMSPSITRELMKNLGITKTSLPMFNPARDRAYWHGPQFVICVSVNNTPGESSRCRIMSMPEDVLVNRIRTKLDASSIFSGAPTDAELTAIKKEIADVSDSDPKARDRVKRNLSNLVSGKIERDMKTLEEYEELAGCYAVVPGAITTSVKSTSGGMDKEVTVTYTQIGLSCTISLPTFWDKDHPEIPNVIPLAAVHTRLYAGSFRGLGVRSYDCWTTLVPYLSYLKFDMVAWVNNRRTKELAVNVNFARLSDVLTSKNPRKKTGARQKPTSSVSYSGFLDEDDDEDEFEADDDAQENGDETMEDATDTGDILSGPQDGIPNYMPCTGYVANPFFIVADTSEFYGKIGISITPTMAQKIYTHAAKEFEARCDSVCQEFVPPSKGGKKSKPSAKDMKKAKKLVYKEFNEYTASVMNEFGIVCLSEGAGNVKNVFKNLDAYNQRVSRTVIVIHVEHVPPELLDRFAAVLEPEHGDELVEFIAGPLLSGDAVSDKDIVDHRTELLKEWKKNEEKQGLTDLITYAGGVYTEFVPCKVPLCIAIMAPNQAWEDGLQEALSLYGPGKVFGESDSQTDEGKKRSLDEEYEEDVEDSSDGDINVALDDGEELVDGETEENEDEDNAEEEDLSPQPKKAKTTTK